MKPISEYDFREIVGKFVIITNDFIKRKYNTPQIAYCYIDPEAGISFRGLGLYKEGNIEIFDNEVVISRYDETISLDFFNSPTYEMKNIAKDIDNNIPEWLITLRNKTEFDKYRSKAFPDDVLIPVRHITEDKRLVQEWLWVRPIRYEKDILTGLTIEDGKDIPKGSLVIIKDIMMNGYDFMSITYELFEYYGG